MSRWIVRCVLALLAGIPVTPIATASIYCGGTVTAVYLTSDGSVVIEGSWRGDYTEICNDQGTFGGVDQVTCLSWYAAAIQAEKAQSKVLLDYEYDNYTCSSLPTYANSITPYYFMNTQ